jgi:hypothetical protein
MVSQLQKGIREGDRDKALFAAAEMAMSGKPGHVVNRLLIIFFEDVGYPRVDALVRLLDGLHRCDELYRQCGSKAGALIQHADFPACLQQLVDALLPGTKTRIAAHMSMYAFTQALSTPRFVIGTTQEYHRVDELLAHSDGEHRSEVAAILWRVGCFAARRDETSLLAALHELYALCGEEWQAVGRQRLALAPASCNTTKKIWHQPLALVALLLTQYLPLELQKVGQQVRYYTVDREHLEFGKASGESRLVLFTLALWICRPLSQQEATSAESEPPPAWYPTLFQAHELTDLEAVRSRRMLIVRGTVRDKHTRTGKGWNGQEWLRTFLTQYPTLQALDLSASHTAALPAEVGTMAYFLREAAKVKPESTCPNPYREPAVAAYLALETEKGTRGLKSRAMLLASMASPVASPAPASASSVPAIPVVFPLDEPWRTAPLGQVPTSRRKKCVYLTEEYAYKGPYTAGTTLNLLRARTVAFQLLGTTQVLLPEFLTTTSGFWCRFRNLATTPRAQWRLVEKVTERMGTYTIVERASLGYEDAYFIMRKDPEDWLSRHFWPLFRDMLRMFLLRVGDMHFHNVLAPVGPEGLAYILDYEESSHRDISGAPLETLFLYKDCAAKDRALLQEGVKRYHEEIKKEINQLRVLLPRIRPLLTSLDEAYQVTWPNYELLLDDVAQRL